MLSILYLPLNKKIFEISAQKIGLLFAGAHYDAKLFFQRIAQCCLSLCDSDVPSHLAIFFGQLRQGGGQKKGFHPGTHNVGFVFRTTGCRSP